MRQRDPSVRALCCSKHCTWNSTLCTALFTLHASPHLISSEFCSPHLSSSQLFSSHVISSHVSSLVVLLNYSSLSEHCSTFLISSKLFLAYLSSSVHQKAFIVREKIVHTKTVARRKLLRREAFAHRSLRHRKAFTHRKPLNMRSFYTPPFYTQKLFTHRSFYTANFSTKQAFTHSKLWHTHTEKALHIASFWKKSAGNQHRNLDAATRIRFTTQLQNTIELRRQPQQRGTFIQPLQGDLQTLSYKTP